MDFGHEKHRTQFPTSGAAAKLAALTAVSDAPSGKASAPSARQKRSIAVNPRTRQEGSIAVTRTKEDKQIAFKPEAVASTTAETRVQTSRKIDGVTSKEHYIHRYRALLGCHEDIVVAQRSCATSSEGTRNALLWNLSGDGAENELRMIQSIEHTAFVRYLSVYGSGACFTVAFEFMPLSLVEVISNKRLEKPQVACILKQSSHTLHEGICLLTAQLIAGTELEPKHLEDFKVCDWGPHSQVVDFFEKTQELKESKKVTLVRSTVKSIPRRTRIRDLSQHPLLEEAEEPDFLITHVHLVGCTTRSLIKPLETSVIS
ncbi:hypothetical protein FDECE_17228 [Fusarium decemcellulare]|nr:hypothetical protein FDECE_17228 [Fusarium decemcellulare]